MKEKNDNQGFGKRLWDFLASVKLSFTLLLAIAVTSIAGTVVPQLEHPSVYVQLYGEAGARMVQNLGLNDMYHAPWFLLLLGLLAVNLIICSLERLPKALEIIRKDPESELQRSRQAKKSFKSALSSAEFGALAEKELGRLIGRVYRGRNDNKETAFAQKGAWSRLGVYIVHSSVLIIMAGGILGLVWGYRGNVQIPEGETAAQVALPGGRVVDLGFGVRLDRFAISFYDNGMPSEYRSDLTFVADGKEAQKSTVIVNDPATFGDITFYQSSYGKTARDLKVAYEKDGQPLGEVALKPGEWTELPGGGRATLILYKDNVEMGAMYSGPVARIGYQMGEDEPVVMNAFRQGTPMPSRGPVKMGIIGAGEVWYTGLQAKYDPGVWFIWVGCCLMVTGFIIAFYMSHRKVWVTWWPAGKNGCKVEIAGSVNKNHVAFNRLLDRLETALNQGSGQGSE